MKFEPKLLVGGRCLRKEEARCMSTEAKLPWVRTRTSTSASKSDWSRLSASITIEILFFFWPDLASAHYSKQVQVFLAIKGSSVSNGRKILSMCHKRVRLKRFGLFSNRKSTTVAEKQKISIN